MTEANRRVEGGPPAGAPDGRRATRAADAVWRRLCKGHSADWLDAIRDLRADGDDFESTLDIWAVALTAELRNPLRRQTASTVLGRLQQLSDGEAADEPSARIEA